MDKSYIVTKSNYFIMNCSYDLSLEEQKIILVLASMVQPEDEDFKPYKLKIKDFMNLLDVDTKTKYANVPRVTKELMQKVFEIKEGKKTLQIAWLSSAEYEQGSGQVELEFSPKLKPYMLKLNCLFTQYKIENILCMKSKYSPRMYEILKCNEFRKQKNVEIEVAELRRLFKAENIYPKYNDFKKKIILKTQTELKEKADVYFDFKEIKTGRKVTSYKFEIISNLKNREKDVLITNEKNKKYCRAEIIAPKDIEDKTNVEINKLIKLMSEHKVSEKDARTIYLNSNKNLSKIEKIYQENKQKNIRNIVAFMTEMVKDGVYQESKKNTGVSKFNNFKERDVDYDSIAEKLCPY